MDTFWIWICRKKPREYYVNITPTYARILLSDIPTKIFCIHSFNYWGPNIDINMSIQITICLELRVSVRNMKTCTLTFSIKSLIVDKIYFALKKIIHKNEYWTSLFFHRSINVSYLWKSHEGKNTILLGFREQLDDCLQFWLCNF